VRNNARRCTAGNQAFSAWRHAREHALDDPGLREQAARFYRVGGAARVGGESPLGVRKPSGVFHERSLHQVNARKNDPAGKPAVVLEDVRGGCRSGHDH